MDHTAPSLTCPLGWVVKWCEQQGLRLGRLSGQCFALTAALTAVTLIYYWGNRLSVA